jgi:hypothetical protein
MAIETEFEIGLDGVSAAGEQKPRHDQRGCAPGAHRSNPSRGSLFRMRISVGVLLVQQRSSIGKEQYVGAPMARLFGNMANLPRAECRLVSMLCLAA